jgi:hypothetical protein
VRGQRRGEEVMEEKGKGKGNKCRLRNSLVKCWLNGTGRRKKGDEMREERRREDMRREEELE